jgi:hypothetical protein
MEMFTSGNGLIIELKVKELIFILMVLNMMVNGLMIYSKDKVEKNGLMELAIRVIMLMERNKVRGYFCGKMVLNMMGSF